MTFIQIGTLSAGFADYHVGVYLFFWLNVAGTVVPINYQIMSILHEGANILTKNITSIEGANI